MKDFPVNFQETEFFLPAEPTLLANERKTADVVYRTDSRHESVPEILERTSRQLTDALSFYAVDLGEPIRKVNQWKELLPRVELFYAIKCNTNQALLKTLVKLGVGFDCASKEEISTMLKLGVEPRNIIFANPCKPVSYIKYANQNDVALMTFDNSEELYKIKENYPDAKLVLRVLTDDSRSVCRFGKKFGAGPNAAKKLLNLAKELELNIVGVSFHVGSGCFDPTAYSDAVQVARNVFDQAEALGFTPDLLDVGGGFPGLDGVDGAPIAEIAACLGEALDRLFPPHVRVIAEPGRYVAAASFSLAVHVVARREVPADNDEEKPSYMYYISDGVYGSFNCLMFDHAKVFPKIMKRKGKFVYRNQDETEEQEELFESSLWGPTCDSMDCISKKEQLPLLEVGDWLVFENMGAYTIAAASAFNGIPLPSLYYTNTEN